jgi:Fe2+ or Zn2+ uptake regulation protein
MQGPAESLFGSRTRALVLGFLAQASKPVTAYAISKALALGVSNVYPEVRRLEASSIVGTRLDAKGSKTYFLGDEDLRRFLLRIVPVMTAEEWFSPAQVEARREGIERAKKMDVRVTPVRGRRGKRPFDAEFRRPRSKDRAVAHLKQPGSVGR